MNNKAAKTPKKERGWPSQSENRFDRLKDKNL